MARSSTSMVPYSCNGRASVVCIHLLTVDERSKYGHCIMLTSHISIILLKACRSYIDCNKILSTVGKFS